MKNTSKLERFDATLNEMEGELVKLKDTSAAYERLQALVVSYSEISGLIEEERQKVKEMVEAAVKDWGQKILHNQKTIKNLALLFGIAILLCAIAIIVILLI